MACGCSKKGPQFQVVAANNKVVFITANEGTANAVARRYGSGASVVPLPAP